MSLRGNTHQCLKKTIKGACALFNWYGTYICSKLLYNSVKDYFRDVIQFLPMHTLPFFRNPSLQVHTNDPKVFVQVECSGHDSMLSHSSTSDGRKVAFIGQIRMTPLEFLPMHTLPFFKNPSLQVHTKEPKVFEQVECSGQVPLVSHSSTSA